MPRSTSRRWAVRVYRTARRPTKVASRYIDQSRKAAATGPARTGASARWYPTAVIAIDPQAQAPAPHSRRRASVRNAASGSGSLPSAGTTRSCGLMAPSLPLRRGAAAPELLRSECAEGRAGAAGLRPGAAGARGLDAGADRGDGSVRRRARPGLPRPRRTDRPDGGDVRRARTCLRVPDLRDPPDAELRLRPGQRRERGAHPRRRARAGFTTVVASDYAGPWAAEPLRFCDRNSGHLSRPVRAR